MNNTKRLKLSLLSLAIGSTLPLPGHTQDSTDSLLLEEVVVTARKRAESLQEVPLAVTAMDARELAISGAADLADIQAQVPGLTAYAARGTTSTLTAYIRGIGQSDPLWGVEPGVGLYLDDVYIARPQGALLEVFDVDRIEVLRGPQGTLYGRNTIGGAIKYISKPIGFDQEGKLQLTLGNYNRQDLVASYSTPLIEDTLAAKLSVASLSHDGLGTNHTTGSDVSDKQVLSGRLSLDWVISDSLSAKLALDATKDTSAPRGGQRMLENPWEATLPVMISGLVTPLVPGLPYYSAEAVAAAAVNGQSPLPVSTDRYDTDSGLVGARNDVTTSGASLTLAYDLNNAWSLKSITAFRQGDTVGTLDFDMGPLPIADVYGEYDDHQFTQELQFNYDNGDSWQAVFGLYYIDATAGGTVKNQFLLAPVLPAGHPSNPLPIAITTVLPQYSTSAGDVITESYSLYGESSWQMTPALSLTLGGRYTREQKTAAILAENYADPDFTSVTATETDFTGSETWSNFSPKIGLDYQFEDHLLLYASASMGFKSGGYNIRAKQVSQPESINPYDEETVTTYEIGFKSTLLERLMLNATYFYSDYDDIQLSIFSQSSDGTFFGDFTNAGKGMIQGVEMEFAAAVTENFSVSGNLAYLDAEYREYLDGGIDVADQKAFTNTPEWTYTLNVTYQRGLSHGADLTARLSYSYRDDVIPTTDLSPILAQKAYDTIDATLAYTTADERWRLALEGRNLTDEEYRTTGYDLRSSGVSIVEGFYGAPRTLAFKASYAF
ncbi:TonB-dependent receptor [Aestuariicella hydrocarbonica]|uniref:TonB-dependent receptor n=1 Tax=Pseudomaricurvus hydrocarbonicus TaxID=1470433 RepID=A0A9E5MM65_9GAMM|nr:TonB-dependent receptor [Aestuariicella hydrocarbonica]NHO65570.1 TonB-dependent receptor [Aestuariicella hydrocarbonica]